MDHLASILEVSIRHVDVSLAKILIRNVYFLFLQLYTKAYEVFKRYSAVPPISPAVSMQGLLKSQALPAQSGAGRFTILIAYRIAQTYFEAGKYDMAIRCAFSTLQLH